MSFQARHECESMAVGQEMARIQPAGSSGRRAWAFPRHAPSPSSLAGAAIKFTAVALCLIMGHCFSTGSCRKFLPSPQIIVLKESNPGLVTWSSLPLFRQESKFLLAICIIAISACHMYQTFVPNRILQNKAVMCLMY